MLSGCGGAAGSSPSKQEQQPANRESGKSGTDAAGKAAGTDSKTEILISAAASLKDALTDLEGKFEGDHEHIDLTFNFAASGTLQKQIEQGAPADLFFSAGEKQMETLSDKKLVGASEVILKNALVLIVPREGVAVPSGLKSLSEDIYTKIALGEPETVPAGQYAKQALTKGGIWDIVQSKIVFAKDVRQVLTYVETGNTDAGLVYQTDAQGSDKIKIALTVPEDAHDPILYPAAVVAGSRHLSEAEEVLAYLKGEEAKKVFQNYGFLIP
ncbi:molybdate ABC transporter substrate-binding protein [Paenibacillus nasutitermitis]|nr:molybdate ABC transporter substrate-binding protein [Paenibacillus nasutitermitis]